MSQPVANLLTNGVNGVTVGGLGTATKFFPTLPGASIGVASTQNGYIYAPGVNRANGQQLEIRATGSYTFKVVPSTTVTIVLAEVDGGFIQKPPASPTINTLVTVTEPTSAEGSVPIPWALRARLNCDNASGLLQGDYSVQINNGAVQAAAISSRSGLSMLNDIPFALLIGISFGTSDAANSATMFQFDLQQ